MNTRQQMTQESKNLEVVARAVDLVWNRGDFSELNTLVDDHIIVHTAAQGDIHGQEGLQHFYSALQSAFPDMRFTVEDQFAHDDKVVTRWRARGTHRGAFQGIPPTGKQVEFTGIDIDRFEDNKVVECWPMSDDLGLMLQLGVVAMPGEAAR